MAFILQSHKDTSRVLSLEKQGWVLEFKIFFTNCGILKELWTMNFVYWQIRGIILFI